MEIMNLGGSDVKRFLIVGTAQKLASIIEELLAIEEITIVGKVNLSEEPYVPVGEQLEPFLSSGVDVILETTGDPVIFADIQRIKNHATVLIIGDAVSWVTSLIRALKKTKQELNSLSHVQTFLKAIINSSEDAISVVDASGNGILINPAYTRLTGLSTEDIIGKPADVDIAEGESMHLKVLRTQKPVRGVHMKVGPKNKDVIVHVAPVIVDGQLKGSVGVIHDTTEFTRLAEELEKAKRIIRTLQAKYTFEEIIGVSDAMQQAVDQARKAALTPATVLLRGESGTGKELFAHAIHNESSRKYSQFIRVNCAAISQQLLESELFGYEEGAFTGARKGGKKGLFEEASGGTIFLDEIGEMSINTQAKLLRVLQEKEIIRVGGTKSIDVDVRIIAATHVNLEKAIQQGGFREDLYYRLNMMPIIIPPLRYRKQDVYALSHHLIHKFNQEYGRAVTSIHPEALHKLEQYDWPGNVRELENVLGRSIINMRFTDAVILARHLPELELMKAEPIRRVYHEQEKTMKLSDLLSLIEKDTIQRVYQQTEKNKTETARRLGLSVRNLYYKFEKYQIDQQDTNNGK